MIVPAHPKEDVNASRTDKEKKVRKKEENHNTPLRDFLPAPRTRLSSSRRKITSLTAVRSPRVVE